MHKSIYNLNLNSVTAFQNLATGHQQYKLQEKIEQLIAVISTCSQFAQVFWCFFTTSKVGALGHLYALSC